MNTILNKLRRRINSIWFPPIIIFTAVMAVVIGSFTVSLNSLEIESKAVVSAYAQGTEDLIQDRIKVFEESLRSGAGLFTGDANVTQTEWDDYIKATGVKARYPGSQTIAYAEVVKKNELNDFLENVKTRTGYQMKIDVNSSALEYAPVVLVSPITEQNENIVGFDVYSDDVRREILEKVRDENRVYLTGVVDLLSDHGEDTNTGIIMYAPQYKKDSPIANVEERRESIEGYLYAVFRTDVFLGNLLDQRIDENISYKIVTAGDENSNEIYQSVNSEPNSIKAKESITDTFTINGATWSVVYSYDADDLLSQPTINRPLTVLLFGTLAAAMISVITLLLLRGKGNQLALDQERDINDAKDSLLSIASHQLRTPATGVKQYLGMIMQGFVGDVSPQQQNMLDKAYESNERQLKTINDVLFLARLDSGRIVLSESDAEIKNMVKSVIEEQRNHIDESKHTLTLHAPDDDVCLSVDEHMIRMSVENLLSNAIKYTKNGGNIDITLSQDKQETKIVVKDDGVGIAKEDQKLLFKQFSRIKNELSKSVSGTGVGLYLVKHIIELHNGTISVDSKQGEGAVFTIVLPSATRK